MNVIKTIDLWTEARDNHYECFNGAFVDGFDNDTIPFDTYKVVKNCNCIINVDLPAINIKNKHHAIIFYKNKKPVRLLVINKNTNIEKCISVALNQFYGEGVLLDVYKQLKISRQDIDLKEKPKYKKDEDREEIDVGSCDRWPLLYSMLKGYYTESKSEYGNFQSDKYYFIPELSIEYSLVVKNETFNIVHKCAFINTIETRLIPIQENSSLTILNN